MRIIICVRQTVDMLHGNFVFLSFREREIDTSNAVFSNGDGSTRKVKLERENYTAAVDILTYFLKLPLISPVAISPIKTTMRDVSNQPHPFYSQQERSRILNFLTMHIDTSSIF